MSSISFSFLINGQPSDWIDSHRALRQGEPISPFLFLLVSQNLIALLNYALNLNLILGFAHGLRVNFNYLTFADGLMIITMASISVSKNSKLCLDIYMKLTSRSPNNLKSTIFLHSWCNKKPASAIKHILNMDVEFLPLDT